MGLQKLVIVRLSAGPQSKSLDSSLSHQLKRFPVIADEIRNSNLDKALMFELMQRKIAWFLF
jgi:hypothetical protein